MTTITSFKVTMLTTHMPYVQMETGKHNNAHTKVWILFTHKNYTPYSRLIPLFIFMPRIIAHTFPTYTTSSKESQTWVRVGVVSFLLLCLPFTYRNLLCVSLRLYYALHANTWKDAHLFHPFWTLSSSFFFYSVCNLINLFVNFVPVHFDVTLVICNLQEYDASSNSNGGNFSNLHSYETCEPVN